MSPKKQKLPKKPEFTYAVGRRKTANARIRLYLKKGDLIVNDKPIEEYFPLESDKQTYTQPLKLTGTLDKFSITAKVEGSGKTGQLEAVVHGIARALAKVDPDKFRPVLKKHGLLTRDSRMKERRKAGLAQSARAKKQSPKR